MYEVRDYFTENLKLVRWLFHFSQVRAVWLVPSSFYAILQELQRVEKYYKNVLHHIKQIRKPSKRTKAKTSNNIGSLEANIGILDSKTYVKALNNCYLCLLLCSFMINSIAMLHGLGYKDWVQMRGQASAIPKHKS